MNTIVLAAFLIAPLVAIIISQARKLNKLQEEYLSPDERLKQAQNKLRDAERKIEYFEKRDEIDALEFEKLRDRLSDEEARSAECREAYDALMTRYKALRPSRGSKKELPSKPRTKKQP